MKTTDELLDDAIGELSAAALQIIPSDDQIIADHVRNSVATLLRFKSAYRSERAVARKAILEEAASNVHGLGHYSESYIDPEQRPREVEIHNYAIWEARDLIRALANTDPGK